MTTAGVCAKLLIQNEFYEGARHGRVERRVGLLHSLS